MDFAPVALCIFCGASLSVIQVKEGGKYCSRTCAGRARRKLPDPELCRYLEDGSRTIPLRRKDQLVAEAIVDADDFEYLSQFVWRLNRMGYAFRVVYSHQAVSPAGRKGGRIKRIAMHRELLDVADSSECVDHINRNPLDNRRSNLRSGTKGQNLCNKDVLPGKKTSRYKGVHPAPSRKNPWRAAIQNRHLGCFPTEEAAAAAYNEAALSQYGEFAFLNDVEVAS